MIFNKVCPLTGKRCYGRTCIDWNDNNREINLCMFWEDNDSVNGEHCRLRMAVNTILSEHDRERIRRRNKPIDLPFDVFKE